MITDVEHCWLGIDFSGNHRMWRSNCKSNIYIAEAKFQEGRLFLSSIRTPQELPGKEEPFQRLANLLKGRRFAAAAIDAPFSIPRQYLPGGSHKRLLELVAELPSPKGSPFPAAQDFVCAVLSGRALANKKPLRRTEARWQKNINVRSTLWAGPRGGAAMTAACLRLLYEADCPIWPWCRNDNPGLLIEAFPAAQLWHWQMHHQKYGDKNDSECVANRRAIVVALSSMMEISYENRQAMEACADALDAVICTFAAMAVSNKNVSNTPSEIEMSNEEGQIAVHDNVPVY